MSSLKVVKELGNEDVDLEEPSVKVKASPLSLPQIIHRWFEIEFVTNDHSHLSVGTDVVLQRFFDRTIVLVSQVNGRIGSYLSCSMEHSIIDRSTVYSVHVLLGKRDDTLVEVLARQIHERIFQFENQSGGESGGTAGILTVPPLLLGVTLNSDVRNSQHAFHELVAMVIEMYKSSCGTL